MIFSGAISAHFQILPGKSSKKYGIPVRIAHSHNSENMGSKLVLISHLQHKKLSANMLHIFLHALMLLENLCLVTIL